MRRDILIWCLVALVLSCRSYRERTNQEATRMRLTETNNGIRYGFQLLGKDSLDRSWSFVTDSLLYFHPQYGLISNGGHLHFLESQLGLQQWQVELDSFDAKRDVHGITETQTQSPRWFDYSWWIWGMVVGCALFLFMVTAIKIK